MAHNLKKNTDGQHAMLYSGETPWHGLGTACPDSFHAHEAMKAFPFTYRKEDLFLKSGMKIEGKQAVVISDTNKAVGVVGDGYEIVQPEDAFTFMDSISEGGKLLYKTVGALGDGERLWLLAHTPNHVFEPVKGDPIEQYLLFSTSYDGSSSNEVRGTSITVVCQNTLHMATQAAPAFMKIRHTRTVQHRLAMAAEIMKGYERQQQSFREAMIYLAQHPITDELVKQFENEMFGDPDKHEEGRSRSILLNKRSKFEELMITGKGTDIKGRVGSAYGLVQAYTEWSDWHSTVRGSGDRTSSIIFGNASKEKTRALEVAINLVQYR